MTASKKNMLVLALLVAVWGSGYLVISKCIDVGWEQGWYGFMRYGIAAVCMLAVVAVRNQWSQMCRILQMGRRKLLITALIGDTFASLTLYYGQREAGSGIAGTLLSTIPLWAVLLSVLLAKMRVSRRTIIGMFIGFAGITVFYLPYMQSGVGLVSALLLLASAACYGAEGMLIHKYYQEVGVVPLLTWLYAIATVSFLPFCAIEPLPQEASAYAWITFSSVGNIVVGFALYIWLVQRAGVTYAAMYAYLVPPVSLALGYWLHSEPLYILSAVSLPIILWGVHMVMKEQSAIDALEQERLQTQGNPRPVNNPVIVPETS